MRFTTALIAAASVGLAAAKSSAHHKASSTISRAIAAGNDAHDITHHHHTHTHTHTPRALANVEVDVTEDDVAEAFNVDELSKAPEAIDKPDETKQFDAADKWVTVTKTAGFGKRHDEDETENAVWWPPKTTTTAKPLSSSSHTKIPFHSQPKFRSEWSAHHRTWDSVYMPTSTHWR